MENPSVVTIPYSVKEYVLLRPRWSRSLCMILMSRVDYGVREWACFPRGCEHHIFFSNFLSDFAKNIFD